MGIFVHGFFNPERFDKIRVFWTNKHKQTQTQKLKFDWFPGHQAYRPQETQNSSNRIRTQPNQCFLFRFLFLCSQSVSVSFCFCFPNLFQLLVSVLFLFLFSQSVNASDGETVRPQDRDYVFCTEFEHRWTNASCLGFCFYVPNLFLSVSVFPICFCFLSLFKFLFSQSINGFGWGNSSTARIATEIMLLCLCFCFPSLFLFMFLFVVDSKMLFFCSLIFNVWLDFFLPRRVNCLL